MAKDLEARQPPVLLFGTTRSGSTLLSLMLGHHPEIAYGGEYQWVFEYNGGREPTNMSAYHLWLEKNRIFQGFRPQIDPLLDFSSLARSILWQMVQPGATKPLLTVAVHSNYQRVHELWTHAKIIHLVRDGRDVAASWLRLGWHGNAWSCAQSWTELLDEWSSLKAKLPAGQYIELRMEDLIDNPSKQLGRLCRFIGVEYSPQMLLYYENSTYAPVTRSRTGNWHRKLSTREIRVFEAMARPKLEAYGYTLSELPRARIVPPLTIALAAENKAKRIRARIREFGFQLWLIELLARRMKWERSHRKALDGMYRITNSKLE